jgi:oleate hydratase
LETAAFNSSIPESYWESFTVTLNDPVFFEKMEAFSSNQPGTGGLVTFKDSRWLMSIVPVSRVNPDPRAPQEV